MSKSQLFPVTTITDLRDMLEKSVATYGDKIAVSFKNRIEDEISTRTYRELAADIDNFSRAYLQVSENKNLGHKIALISENRYEWLVTYLAVVNSGRVIVPIDPGLTASEISNLISRSQAQTVIFSKNLREKILILKKLQPSLTCYLDFDTKNNYRDTISWWSLLASGQKLTARNALLPTQKIDPQALCTLIFTSGTTGQPKGIMLTHQNLASNAMGFCQRLNFTEETLLSFLPLNHSLAAMCDFIAQLYRGSHLFFLPGGIRELGAQLRLACPTVFFSVPLVVENCYQLARANLPPDADLPLIQKTVRDYFGGRLTKIVVGGAPMSADFIAKYDELKIPVLHGYGLTENSPVVAVNPVDDRVDDSVGLPLPNLNLKIAKPDKNSIGEILVQGPSVMLGYYEDKNQTQTTLVDGWLHTGDLGFLDQTGHLHITGRKKNIIVGKNGKNVYPEELELLLKNLRFVSENLVYGENLGQKTLVVALIVADKKNILATFGVYTEEIAQAVIHEEIRVLNRSLAKHQQIKKIKLSAALPRTSTGKIKRDF